MEKYFNGSDMLLGVGTKAVGHSTGHTTTFNNETKDHTVKAPASATSSAALYKEKNVTAKSVTIKSDGLVYCGESETTFAELLKAYANNEPIEVKCYERDKSTKPYLKGKFIISSLERNDPANDDSTWSVNLENTGAVTFDFTATAITDGVTA